MMLELVFKLHVFSSFSRRFSEAALPLSSIDALLTLRRASSVGSAHSSSTYLVLPQYDLM